MTGQTACTVDFYFSSTSDNNTLDCACFYSFLSCNSLIVLAVSECVLTNNQ